VSNKGLLFVKITGDNLGLNVTGSLNNPLVVISSSPLIFFNKVSFNFSFSSISDIKANLRFFNTSFSGQAPVLFLFFVSKKIPL
jgi:hypothetical protein